MAPSLTTVVIPVKDEDSRTVTQLLYELDQYHYPVILVDDGSKTPMPGAAIRFEPPGKGYGTSLKYGIEKASTELVCTMDGDGQHSARDVKRLEEFLCYFPQNAMIIGDRRLKERGIRLWGRKVLNWTASLLAGRWVPDLNSGLRIFKRSIALGYTPILANGFSYTTSLTISMLADHYEVDWLPVKVSPRLQGSTKVHCWRDGLTTLRYILVIGLALRTRRLRAFLRPLIRPLHDALHC